MFFDTTRQPASRCSACITIRAFEFDFETIKWLDINRMCIEIADTCAAIAISDQILCFHCSLDVSSLLCPLDFYSNKCWAVNIHYIVKFLKFQLLLLNTIWEFWHQKPKLWLSWTNPVRTKTVVNGRSEDKWDTYITLKVYQLSSSPRYW